MMQKSSTEQRIFKEGDSRVYTIKSYRQVNSPPGGNLLKHTPTSLPRSRREKSTESRLRFYCSRLSKAQRRSRPDGHQSGLPKTTPSQAASTSQCHLLMTIAGRDSLRSTARRLGRAQVHLNFVSITIFREAHLLDVDE
jgi:hypothetical protein